MEISKLELQELLTLAVREGTKEIREELNEVKTIVKRIDKNVILLSNGRSTNTGQCDCEETTKEVRESLEEIISVPEVETYVKTTRGLKRSKRNVKEHNLIRLREILMSKLEDILQESFALFVVTVLIVAFPILRLLISF